MVAPDSDAFPSRQAEWLDDELEVGFVHELFEPSEVIERPKLRASGDVFASHELPRELLVRFELSRLARRADRRDPRGFQRIRYPLLERRLGPMTARATARSFAHETLRSTAVTSPRRTSLDRRRIPGFWFVIAAKMSAWLRCSASTIACSRPPPPTTSTFMGQV